MSDTKTVYISIGNSDDKLTQAEWSDFVRKVDGAVRHYGPNVHGFWLSPSDARWQNACWCVECPEDLRWPLATRMPLFRLELGQLAQRFSQESIAWAEATTEFIKPTEATHV